MGVAANFAEKTFANGPKTSKFAKVFSLESFRLYGIHLHVIMVPTTNKDTNVYINKLILIE